MKSNYLNLWTMGRVKDRTGAYKLPNGNVFPKFGTAGRQRAVLPSAVRPSAPAPVAQPSLFKGLPAPVPAPAPTSAPVPLPARPLPHTASPASPVSPSSKWNLRQKISAIAASLWSVLRSPSSVLRPVRPHLPRLKLRLPRFLHLFSRRPARDSRPRAQAELVLEKVTVLRNDLSESDLVIVPVARKAAEAPPARIAGNPWSRVTARWIKLKDAPASNVPAVPPGRSGELAGIEP